MIALIIYLLTFWVVTKIKEKRLVKFKPFPKLILKRKGIFFYSKTRHRLKIGDDKFVQIRNDVYLKTNDKVVIVSNIDKVMFINGYLYFTALGRISINLDLSKISNYFNVEILSKKFNLNEQKQLAILDILNNNFDLKFCKNLKKYINNIENILNINIFSKKIIVKQNKFNLPFVLKYKLNNKIKKVYVNQTLEEN